MPGVLHLAKLSAEVQPRRRHGEGMAEAWRRHGGGMAKATVGHVVQNIFPVQLRVLSRCLLGCVLAVVRGKRGQYVHSTTEAASWCLFALSSYLCHASTKLGMSAAGT